MASKAYSANAHHYRFLSLRLSCQGQSLVTWIWCLQPIYVSVCNNTDTTPNTLPPICKLSSLCQDGRQHNQWTLHGVPHLIKGDMLPKQCSCGSSLYHWPICQRILQHPSTVFCCCRRCQMLTGSGFWFILLARGCITEPHSLSKVHPAQ